jgi:hypothetical protein
MTPVAGISLIIIMANPMFHNQYLEGNRGHGEK